MDDEKKDAGTNPAQEAVELTAILHLRSVIEKVDKPDGYLTLGTEDRRFLLSALLGSMVPVDGKVRQSELEKLHELLSSNLNAMGKTFKEVMSIAQMKLGEDPEISKVAKRIPDILSIEDRIAMVGMLWDLALVDHELHKSEEGFIYKIADGASVPRKKVAEMQARSAAKLQWR